LRGKFLFAAHDSFLKFDLLDRKYNPVNRFMMGLNGTEFKAINHVSIKDPETNLPLFSNTKSSYRIEKLTRNLESNIVHVEEVVSPVEHDLRIDSRQSIDIKGVEGTFVDGKSIFLGADGGILLKSQNGSIRFLSPNGIYIDIDRIPVAPEVEQLENRSDLQFKLCICLPKGALYRVSLSKSHSFKDDPCRHYDRHHFDPCL
jgi:hypothetical protein